MPKIYAEETEKYTAGNNIFIHLPVEGIHLWSEKWKINNAENVTDLGV